MNHVQAAVTWIANRYRVLLIRRAFGRTLESLRYARVRPRFNHRFYIVSAQRNMGETALRCLQSVYEQDYPRQSIRHFFVDDSSTDETPTLVESWIRSHPDNCVSFVRNHERLGMLANNLAGFRRAEDTDIGIELNGDDWLPDAGVLKFLNKVYDNDIVWMTYNTPRQTNGTVLFQVQPPRKVRQGIAFRQSPWMTSHLHTFRMTLHRRLPKEVFIDPETGDHWDLSQDMAVYLPMLELAGNHAKHLYRITCTYNLHAASDHMQARPAQLEAEQRIRETPSCQPLDELSPHLSTPSD